MHFPQVSERAAVDNLAIALLWVEGEEEEGARLLASGKLAELRGKHWKKREKCVSGRK